MENLFIIVLVLILFVLLVVLLVVVANELYNKYNTSQKKLKVILDGIQSDIIYVDIMDANYSYAGDILMYARLTDKYLSIESNRDSILTVSNEPSPFYNKNVDALISYISLYTDKPVKVNYPEK